MSNRIVERVNPIVSVVAPPGPPGPVAEAVYSSYGSTAGISGPQAVPSGGASIVAKLDTDLGSSAGFSLVAVGSGHGIVVPITAVYEVTYSIQLETLSGTEADVRLWLLRNGAAVLNSASVVAMSGNVRYSFPYFSAFLALTAGENVAVALTNTGGDSPQIVPIAATAVYPATPGAILSLKRIGS